MEMVIHNSLERQFDDLKLKDNLRKLPFSRSDSLWYNEIHIYLRLRHSVCNVT